MNKCSRNKRIASSSPPMTPAANSNRRRRLLASNSELIRCFWWSRSSFPLPIARGRRHWCFDWSAISYWIIVAAANCWIASWWQVLAGDVQKFHSCCWSVDCCYSAVLLLLIRCWPTDDTIMRIALAKQTTDTWIIFFFIFFFFLLLIQILNLQLKYKIASLTRSRKELTLQCGRTNWRLRSLYTRALHNWAV